MFNIVILTGRLTADPELRTTDSGVAVTGFSVAVQRKYKSGEEAVTDFINVVAWRHTAEFVCKYFKKGSLIGIEGSMLTRKYQDKETGKNRTAFEVLAGNVQFVESRRNNDVNIQVEDPLAVLQDNLTAAGIPQSLPEDDGDLPF